MMTYRVGVARGAAVAKAISEYYLSDTLRSENMRAAEYYSGRQEQSVSFWDNKILTGHLEMEQHHADLRPDLSSALAATLGVHGQALTPERVANLLSLKQADGGAIAGRQIHRPKADGKRKPIGFIDLTLSAPKSLSVAWGLAPTKEERDALLGIHRTAVAKTMAYVAEEIAYTQRGGKQNRRSEFGDIAWIGFQHYTSRPVGQQAADPQLHTHNIVLPHVLTPDGHVGALDLDHLNGRIKEFGYVYQAFVAQEARKLGIRVEADKKNGAARLSAIPDHIIELFSKRQKEAIAKAEQHASRMGLDWAELSEERKIGLTKTGAYTSREEKDEINDLASWSRQADESGYLYESVRDQVEPAIAADVRPAYDAALPLLADEFQRRPVLDEKELRVAAARALVATNITDGSSDIDSVVKSFREHGVEHEGRPTRLVEAEVATVRGKDQRKVTTSLALAQECELIALAKSAAADASSALGVGQIDTTGLSDEQDRMVQRLGTGGRLTVAMGVAGAGKTLSMAKLTEAWKENGRTVFGTAIAWRAASGLKAAGIEETASIAAFLRRVETQKYQLDRHSVIVIDEASLVGTRQMRDLLKVQEKTRAQLVMIGDPRQGQPVEGASGLELLREALGEEAIPRLTRTVRQDTQREREIATLFRRGRVAEALDMKREDKTAELVPGGREETIARGAGLWRERTEANRENPRFQITISTATNADAREIGTAIREEMRTMGRLGPDLVTVKGTDRTGAIYDLPIATGERLRLFARHRGIGNNGDIVEVKDVRTDGLVVRNKLGAEALLPWTALRQHPTAPVRLAPGYAVTHDVAQGMTSTEHVNLVFGSRSIGLDKAYVAASRHRSAHWLLIDEATERADIAERTPLGQQREIREHDV